MRRPQSGHPERAGKPAVEGLSVPEQVLATVPKAAKASRRRPSSGLLLTAAVAIAVLVLVVVVIAKLALGPETQMNAVSVGVESQAPSARDPK
jgi:hypothetical protein